MSVQLSVPDTAVNWVRGNTLYRRKRLYRRLLHDGTTTTTKFTGLCPAPISCTCCRSPLDKSRHRVTGGPAVEG